MIQTIFIENALFSETSTKVVFPLNVSLKHNFNMSFTKYISRQNIFLKKKKNVRLVPLLQHKVNDERVTIQMII